MKKQVLVIGAGMGGLTAALSLARRGCTVQVVEARSEAGGLASGSVLDGFSFDAGPYILLDRPGLETAFSAVGLDLSEQVELRRIESVYEVAAPTGEICRFHADEERTSAGFERDWPGSGALYRRFVADTRRTYQRLSPLLQRSRPKPADLIRVGAWRDAPFLLRSLGAVLANTGLPWPVRDSIGIWTHIAGESIETAPSPLAFVPSLIHTVGAYYPVGGIQAVPRALAAAAIRSDIEIRYNTLIRAIRTEGGAILGAETTEGDFLPADAIVSNAGGISTYCDLVDMIPATAREELGRLPLQSPGVCAYLAVKGSASPPYLRFQLHGGDELCRLLIRPAVMDSALICEGWHPARLLAPMRHEMAERIGPEGQRAYLEKILAERWWQEGITEFRVLGRRSPADWGAEFHLYRNSMNPVMTARFMRQGRLAHRSPYVKGLYLAGSATHPGQWVSFCALSGILAAECVREDMAL